MKNYLNKKVALLRGYPRLIDGESTSVEEMYKWGLKNDVSFKAFHLHAPWKRKEPMYKDGYEHPYKIFTLNMIDEVIKELNGYDLVILINPSKPHSGLKAEDVRAFHKIYKEIDSVKVQMQHNHFVKAVNEIPFCWSYINASDACFNLSDGWFTQEIINRLPSKKDRSGKYHLWVDTDRYKDFYKNEDRELSLTYIGRFVLYKGPRELLNLAPALIKSGIKPVIHGMDTSIGCKQHVLSHPNANNLLQLKQPRNENPIVDVNGKLEHHEVFETFNKSMFAAVLINLKSDTDKGSYGDKLEYIMQEAIMSGSILVVNKEWANNCRTKDGIKYADIENFAVQMDLSAPAGAIRKMKEIANDPELQRKYRETAFEVLKYQYDSSVVLDELMAKLFNVDKDPYKFETMYDLVKFITKSESKTEEFCKRYEAGHLLPMVPRAMGVDKISEFTGVSGKAIREITV